MFYERIGRMLPPGELSRNLQCTWERYFSGLYISSKNCDCEHYQASLSKHTKTLTCLLHGSPETHTVPTLGMCFALANAS